MRTILTLVMAWSLANVAQAESIDPNATELPWLNGPSRDSVYQVWENYNKVHVWEALSNTCPWCHNNAPQVAALKAYFDDLAANDPDYERVQFLDLCLGSVQSCESWTNQHTPDYPVVHDDVRYVWNNLRQANSIPQTFVTDCAGNLVGSTIGYWSAGDIEAIKGYVETAMAVECAEPTR